MRARTARQRGIALILVLWSFMTLGVLAFDFGRTMREDAMAAVNFGEETQAYYATLAVMNRRIFETQLDQQNRIGSASVTGAARGGAAGGVDDEEEEGEAPLIAADGEWHEDDFGDTRVKVRITDECSRIPINTASPAVLTRVVQNLVNGPNATQGVDRREQGEVDGLVSAIIDWRDSDHTKSLNGAESEYYRSARGYPAKNAPFASVEELLLVKGVTADLFYGRDGRPGLRDIVSVYCGNEYINGRGITAPVLQALGLEAEEAETLVARRGDDRIAFQSILQARLNALDPTLAQLVQFDKAQTVRVEGVGDVKRDRNQTHIAAVLDIEDAGLGDKPLARVWMDRAPWQGAIPRGDVAVAGARPDGEPAS